MVFSFLDEYVDEPRRKNPEAAAGPGRCTTGVRRIRDEVCALIDETFGEVGYIP
ncbi:MAG: hypothetical protein JXA08_02460 [Methanomicrobiaceae archaeon]|nr:hypothetical protein [Methanomicrobiaceae archaeon]